MKDFELTYFLDGELYKTAMLAKGSKIAPRKAPVKEGYTFSGWSEIPEIMPEEKVEVFGTFTKNSYMATFLVDGLTLATSEIPYGEPIVPPEAPLKEGLVFSSWKGLPESMPAEDIRIDASYEEVHYTAYFTLAGEPYASFDVSVGAPIPQPEMPQKAGYTFSGWVDMPDKMPEQDITLTGEFHVNSYLLTYVIDGETVQSEFLTYLSPIVPYAEPTRTGYTFSGWGGVPATMPAMDVVVKGNFTPNTYRLIYKLDGAQYLVADTDFEESITPLSAPAKEGFTFSGWTEIPVTMPASDVVIHGSFSRNSYTLSFVLDGEVVSSSLVMYGANISPVAVEEKTGYTFTGWKKLPKTMPACDLEITGSYKINSYTMTYQLDGEVVNTFVYQYDAPVTPVEAPVKEGYTFSGWGKIPKKMPAKDVILNGYFTRNEYELIFAVEGGMRFPRKLFYGDPITPIAEPVRPHHTFSGWGEIPETMPAHDVIVTGHFTIDSYNLTLLLNGEIYQEYMINYGTELNFTVPEKEGYTFSGFKDLPATMPDHNVVASGHYAVNYYRLVYEVAGEMTFPRSVAYGTPLKPLAEPTRLYHTFSGWGEIPETMPAHDVLIRGSFTTNTYPLTYRVDNEDIWNVEILWNTDVPTMEEPQKEGYTFSGWSEIPVVMPAEPVVVSGDFTVNYYKLTYLLNGETFYEEDVAYGDIVKLLSAPMKEGYTFSGWGEVPMTMPASDVTVEGSLEQNEYTVSFVADGEVVYSRQVRFGDLMPEAPVMEREGYTFSGWSEMPETMPAENVKVKGRFTLNSYTLTFSINNGEFTVPATVAYGTPIFPIEAPVREYYEFSGWDEMPETMPASDLTVSGTLRAVSFPITYVVNGQEWRTDMVPYETAPAAYEDLSKTGYTFSGWEGLPREMPAAPVTVTGKFTPNEYVLTYAVEGEICLSESVACDTPLNRLFTPEKEGYTFSGWKDVPAVMPAHDLILRGEFTKA